MLGQKGETKRRERVRPHAEFYPKLGTILPLPSLYLSSSFTLASNHLSVVLSFRRSFWDSGFPFFFLFFALFCTRLHQLCCLNEDEKRKIVVRARESEPRRRISMLTTRTRPNYSSSVGRKIVTARKRGREKQRYKERGRCSLGKRKERKRARVVVVVPARGK